MVIFGVATGHVVEVLHPAKDVIAFQAPVTQVAIVGCLVRLLVLSRILIDGGITGSTNI